LPEETQAAAQPVASGGGSDDEEGGIRFRRRPAEEGGLDMTPMVDVVFQLLIFFMLTCSFSVQKSMQTESPEPDEEGAAQAVTLQDVEADSIIVEIDAENRIKVDGELVASIGMLADVLASKAAEQPPRTEMLIEADYNASHGTVVQVTDAGIDANMQHIRRVSRQAED
jgi:biopolymer transport protein ExbD